MAKKGLTIWLFSSLTFISIVHLTDAIFTLAFGDPMWLFQLYPFIGEKLQTVTPSVYLWVSGAASLIFWGITCAIAFENPVETFLNKVLSDAKTQSGVENQLLENKSEILDVMFETMEASNQTLAQVKDLICNVRTEAKEIQPLKETIEKMRAELVTLKKEFGKISEKRLQKLCPACGKPLLPEFNMCPYCGEDTKLLQPAVINLKDYK